MSDSGKGRYGYTVGCGRRGRDGYRRSELSRRARYGNRKYRQVSERAGSEENVKGDFSISVACPCWASAEISRYSVQTCSPTAHIRSPSTARTTRCLAERGRTAKGDIRSGCGETGSYFASRRRERVPEERCAKLNLVGTLGSPCSRRPRRREARELWM